MLGVGSGLGRFRSGYIGKDYRRMIFGQLDPLESRRIVGRTADHLPHFLPTLVRQIGVELSQGWHTSSMLPFAASRSNRLPLGY